MGEVGGAWRCCLAAGVVVVMVAVVVEEEEVGAEGLLKGAAFAAAGAADTAVAVPVQALDTP